MNGCFVVSCDTITEPPQLILTTSNDTTANIGDTITICANGGGGIPPYGYQWNTGDTIGCITIVIDSNICYYVTLTDSCEMLTDSVCITITVGMEDPSPTQSLNIHPNPTTGVFTVQGATGKIEVYDLFGRKVVESDQQTIDLSQQPKGIYMVRIATGQGITIKKVVVQ